MLTSFTLENFKSFREPATLPLAPLTMLAGANASGKSNLVEALRLLSIGSLKATSFPEYPSSCSMRLFPIRGTAKVTWRFEGQRRFILFVPNDGSREMERLFHCLERSCDDKDGIPYCA